MTAFWLAFKAATGLIAGWMYAIVLICLALALGATTLQRNYARDALTVYRAQVTEATAKAEADSRAKERDLQTRADENLKAKDDELKAIDSRLRSTLASLRIARKPRPAADVPAPARACNGATGADLYGPDSEFLARESARADRLRSALDQCYTQYNAAREALKGTP
jgi:uncharacterized iron-regulated membrane protein